MRYSFEYLNRPKLPPGVRASRTCVHPKSTMGPQDPKDVARDVARDLSGLGGELASLQGDATHWLTDPEYAALRRSTSQLTTGKR
jgi:hypothetical protein